MNDTPSFSIDGRVPLRGCIRPVGDKSISHRALIFNALARGEARVSGGNPGADLRSTASCLRGWGVAIEEEGSGAWRVRGTGGRLRPATNALHCGNSGTTMRLLAGVAAGQEFTSTLVGDASLERRPMARVARPLRTLGARVEGPSNGERPPLIVTGPIARGGRVEIEVASAQVKSCLLLAALCTGLEIEVAEPGHSRDHTERMLQAMGAALEFGVRRAHLHAGSALEAIDVAVPGDPSAAALLACVAAAVPGSELSFDDLLANPTRTGFVRALEAGGAGSRWESMADRAGDRVGRWTVTAPDVWHPIHVASEDVPSCVDEIPALAAWCAFADGSSEFDGVGELRVKESDRVSSTRDLLAAYGVACDVEGDRMIVRGGTARRPDSGVPSTDDHRIAMAATILAAGTSARDGGGPIPVDLSAAHVSHPDFGRDVATLQEGPA